MGVLRGGGAAGTRARARRGTGPTELEDEHAAMSSVFCERGRRHGVRQGEAHSEGNGEASSPGGRGRGLGRPGETVVAAEWRRGPRRPRQNGGAAQIAASSGG